MKIKRLICFMLMLIMAISICSCSDKNNDLIEYEAEIYFMEAGKNNLEAERVKLYVSTMDKVYESIINKMLEGPTSQTLMKIMPEGTKLLSNKLEGTVITLDFSKEIYTPDESRNILIRTAILKTMTAVEGIDGVELLVEGEKMRDSDGGEIEILLKDNIVYDTEPEMAEMKYIKLYFSDAKAEKLVAEAREISISQKETMEMRILKELIAGPVNQKLSKTIPAETKILSVETKEGVCFVNLSQEFKTRHSGGSAGEIMTVYSIVNSLTELEHIDKVQFLVEGQKLEVFIHMIFNEPFIRDSELIQK